MRVATQAAQTAVRCSRSLIELRSMSVHPIDPRFARSRQINTSSSTQNVGRPRLIVATSSPCPWQLHASSLQDVRRHFHVTSPVLKGKKENRSDQSPRNSRSQTGGASEQSSPEGTKHPEPSPEDPLDFADVESRLARHDERSADILKKIKAGGRFNPDLIGSLRVQPDKKDAASYPIRELAQIVPKGGRMLSLLVHEAAYIKPIMSAIQASKDFNQQPQRDPDNELELLLKIEPESREDVVKRVKAVCHEWRERVRKERQKRDQKHTAWSKDKVIGPDLKNKLNKELDKLIKVRIAKIDAAEKEALKAAEGK